MTRTTTKTVTGTGTKAGAGAAGRSRRREAGEVVRVDSQHAFISFPAWCAGQALVRTELTSLTAATGRTGTTLLHTEVTAVITTTALLEDDLDPQNWQPAHP